MRNPVLVVMSLLAGLSAVLGLGTLQDLVSPVILGWLLVAQAAVTAGVQFWVHGSVTPLVDPRNAQGHQLVDSGKHAIVNE
jgi:protein-S-isoprenylcysteine O-methyltransferase Ste14